MSDAWEQLAGWSSFDTWIVVTAALAAMACALPGTFLLLRRESMLGDALSHTSLPGIVIALLVSQSMLDAGWISPAAHVATEHAMLFAGAIVVGVLTTLLTDWVNRLGRVESSAALGVVFTSLFAFGLLLIRMKADDVHIDPDCVLYGTLETIVLGARGVPAETVAVGVVLLVNVGLVLIFYKELKLSTFDPQLATTLGIPARWMHYGLTAFTAATLVAVFRSVGSILVISMLIAPAATGFLFARRLSRMLVLSLAFAAASAVIGHVFALTVPSIFLEPLGVQGVTDASTTGMMAVAAGGLFVMAVLFSPRNGVVSGIVRQAGLTIRIAADDVLGILFRMEEGRYSQREKPLPRLLREAVGTPSWLVRAALWRLRSRRLIERRSDGADGFTLTDAGRDAARQLVRSHRLWESYVARHFQLPDARLHQAAELAEHYINPKMQDQLARELHAPGLDPQGRPIPESEPLPGPETKPAENTDGN